MNEYWIEDEYSFYEIDPDCKIGLERSERGRGRFRRTERSRHTLRCSCSFWILLLLLMNSAGSNGR